MRIFLANPSYKYPVNKTHERYFVRSGSRWPHSRVKRNSSPPGYLPFPFFLSYTAGLLLKDRHDVHVLDGVALDYDDEQFIKEAQGLHPEVILLETTTPTIEHDIYISQRLKEATCAKIILAGPHATVYADSIMKNSPCIDYILKGEYELNCAELIKKLSNNSQIRDVSNLVYRDSDQIITSANAIDRNKSLDILPIPARKLFPSNKFNDINRYWDGFCQFRPAIQMQATRGCPYQCYFCLWNEVMYNTKEYRKFSTYRVIEEMEYVIKEYGAREIYFDDDDFTIDKTYVSEICHLIIKRKMDIKWSCMADAINLDKEMLKLMGQAGCIGVKFGIESLSPKVLQMIGKPISLEKANEIAKHCRKYKIKSHAAFAIGLLNEDIDSLNETYRRIRTLNVDTMQISLATPFPGTRFYDLAKSKGFIQTENWRDYDGAAKQALKYPGLNGNKLTRYKINMYRYWLINRILDPAWLIRQLRYLKKLILSQGLRVSLKQIINILLGKS